MSYLSQLEYGILPVAGPRGSAGGSRPPGRNKAVEWVLREVIWTLKQ